MGHTQSALVVGGGIIGVTSAYALARDGWNVCIVDSREGVAQGASWGNGRQLSYSHTNALASPRILTQVPRLLLGCDQAFRLSLRADASFVRWLTLFLANCSSNANKRNTIATLRLAERSRSAMNQLLARHPIEFAHKNAGKIVLLRSDEEVRSARASMLVKQRAGLEQELLSPTEAVAIEPALEQASGDLFGALYSPNDASGDCTAFAQGLLDVAQQEFGVEFRGGSGAIAISRRGGRSIVELTSGEELAADLVVVANGHGIGQLTKPMGHSLPVEPMKGYSFTAPLGNSAPLTSVTDHKRRIVFTHLGDRMLVAGIAEMGRVDGRVDPVRLQSMIEAARASLPQAAVYDQTDEGWAGMRPMTPSSQPITRMLEPGIAVNGGHGMLGWTLAMGSAEELATVARHAN